MQRALSYFCSAALACVLSGNLARTAHGQALPLPPLLRSHAQAAPSMPSSSGSLADAPGASPPVDRDRLIHQLMRRIERLEQMLAAMSPAQTGQAAARAAPSVQVPAAAASTSAAAGLSDTGAAAQAQLDDASRALERTLVREGGLVLPQAAFEVEPRLSHEHRSLGEARLVTGSGGVELARASLRRDFSEISLGLRMGLPADWQLELFLPYAASRQHTAIAGILDDHRERSGWANPEIGISKQWWRDDGSRPALLGTLRYRHAADTGNFSSAVPVASSFSLLQAGITLVKRHDPLVFFATLNHGAQFSRRLGGVLVDPGNPSSIKLGSLLALSPDTSLRLAFELTRAPEIRANHAKLVGTDQTVALFSAGYSFVLSPRALLGMELGIGLTRDAPDFRLTTWLPIRF